MRALFVFFSLLLHLSAFSQNAIRFAYDALGNRIKREIVLPVAIIAYRQYISLNKQVIPMEISIYIGVTIREIRHTHLVMPGTFHSHGYQYN